MTNNFMQAMDKQDFVLALEQFESLSQEQKLAMLQQLQQQSANHRKPLLVSVLRREIKSENTFDDFYRSWFPPTDSCNPVTQGEQLYQQHFPIPVRTINASNISNPKDIISIGLTWVNDAEQEAGLWQHIQQAQAGEDENNEKRHEKIEQIADGELLGLFKVESDDNLGSPF